MMLLARAVSLLRERSFFVEVARGPPFGQSTHPETGLPSLGVSTPGERATSTLHVA